MDTSTLILDNPIFEKELLGKIIYDKESLVKVLEILTEEDFSNYFHRLVFKLIKKIVSENKDVDILSIYNEIQLSEFDKRDLSIYHNLIEISESGNLFYNVDSNIKALKNYTANRKLFQISHNIIEKLHQHNNAEEIKKETESELLKVNTDIELKDQASFSSDIELFLNEFNELNSSLEQGILTKPKYLHSTNYHNLDEALTGGFVDTNFIIIGGRPAMGKTTFMLNVAWNQAKLQKKKVKFFSLEMSKSEIIRKILSMELGVETFYFKNGTLNKPLQARIKETLQKIKDTPFFIDDDSSLTPQTLRNKLKKSEIEGNRIELCYIDYLQLMDSDTKESNRVQEITKITREIKKQCKDFNIPIIAAAQLSRENTKRGDKTPQLSDLKESGSIEQDANIVLFTHRDDYYDPNSTRRKEADIIIAKNRDGATETIKFLFQSQISKFLELKVN